jgi:hypothetical protein
VRVLSTRWVKFFFWIYLLFLVCAFGTVTNPADPDLWHRLAVGEYLWQKHAFPAGGTFSYLADYHDIADHEWGGGLIFYGLWRWGGEIAVVEAKLAALAVTLMFVIWAGMRERRPTAWLTAFYALVLLAMLPSFASTLRCMVFTHILFALWLWWFQRERHGRSVPTAFYVASMILWANLHGGFAIGLAWLFIVALVEACERRPWKLWAVRFGLCAAATLVNPFGWNLWIATARALLTTRRGFGEWAPVSWIADIGSYPGYKVLLVGLIGAVLIQAYRRGWARFDRTPMILVAIFLVISFLSARHTSLFALVAGALVPDFLPLKWPHILSLGPLRRLGVMGINSTLLIVPLFVALMMVGAGAGLTLEYPGVSCPVGPVTFLQAQRTPGKLLVPFNYGSYALWELRGQMRVSMDGRYDLVYTPATYQRVDDFFAARGDWHGLLTDPAPDAILVPRGDEVYPKLLKEPAWREAWHDATDAVFLPR